METLYKYVGLTKKQPKRNNARSSAPKGLPSNNEKQVEPKQKGNVAANSSSNSAGTKVFNTAIDIPTMVKRVQINYRENNGNYLPGYLRTPGFIGTLKPTFGYTFGDQSDIRDLVARNGWLTVCLLYTSDAADE